MIMVGTSQREYYKNGNRSAYIVLNSGSGKFRVYLKINENRPSGYRLIEEYKTLEEARNWMSKRGFTQEV